MDGDRQTDRLPHLILIRVSSMWESKPRTIPQKTSRVVVGPAEGTRPKTCKVYHNDSDDDGDDNDGDNDDDDDDDNNNNNNNNLTKINAKTDIDSPEGKRCRSTLFLTFKNRASYI
jgi:hypothetical protein